MSRSDNNSLNLISPVSFSSLLFSSRHPPLSESAWSAQTRRSQTQKSLIRYGNPESQRASPIFHVFGRSGLDAQLSFPLWDLERVHLIEHRVESCPRDPLEKGGGGGGGGGIITEVWLVKVELRAKVYVSYYKDIVDRVHYMWEDWPGPVDVTAVAPHCGSEGAAARHGDGRARPSTSTSAASTRTRWSWISPPRPLSRVGAPLRSRPCSLYETSEAEEIC